jgi:hypothetical protein
MAMVRNHSLFSFSNAVEPHRKPAIAAVILPCSSIRKPSSSPESGYLIQIACQQHTICQHPRNSLKPASRRSLPSSRSITRHGMRVRTQLSSRKKQCTQHSSLPANTHSNSHKLRPRPPLPNLPNRAHNRHLPQRRRVPGQIPQQRRDGNGERDRGQVGLRRAR